MCFHVCSTPVVLGAVLIGWLQRMQAKSTDGEGRNPEESDAVSKVKHRRNNSVATVNALTIQSYIL